MGANALLASILCLTLPETKGLPTAETMDSDEGAELAIQNVAMDDIELIGDKGKDKGRENSTEVENDLGIQNVAMDDIALSEEREKGEGEGERAEVEKGNEEGKNGTKEEEKEEDENKIANPVDNTTF